MLKNYRPISNIPLLSEVIKKVVARRLGEHLDSQDMQERFQSVYRKKHSTETALVRVTDDIKLSLDNKKGTLLMLLDLSAAFDTIDHRSLLSRLRRRFGVQCTASKWMTSYLDGRIIIGQASSSSKPLNTGVPQGSVLGPILFSLYEQPIGEIIRKHGLTFHHNADDLQILITFDLNIVSLLDAIRRLEECIAEIKTWITANYLKVNDDKSEFMPVVPGSAAHLLEGLTISIGEVRVSAVKNVMKFGCLSGLSFGHVP